jgi:hypothetical protein
VQARGRHDRAARRQSRHQDLIRKKHLRCMVRAMPQDLEQLIDEITLDARDCHGADVPGSGGQHPKPTISWSFPIPLTAEILCFVIAPHPWRSTGSRASADKPRRWPNATTVIVAGRARTASVNGRTPATLGCSSWATRQAAPPVGGVKELTGAGSMRTAITLSPKSHKSSIRRSDLITPGVDKGVPTTGSGRPRIGDRPHVWTGRVSSAVTFFRNVYQERRNSFGRSSCEVALLRRAPGRPGSPRRRRRPPRPAPTKYLR